ncbi:MAG: SusE domain-containing protein [Ferruginibacter sp.]
MKIFFKTLMAVAGMMLFFSACNKVDDLPVYDNGKSPVLSASTLTVAATAADADNDVITFSWTNPVYATDSASYKYVLQLDSAGRGFGDAATVVTIGALERSLKGQELNKILLDFGFAFNVAYSVDVRLISSYGNNNERLFSNVITINATPYKIPPKVQLPGTSRLFITGGATDFNWTNPAPMPAIRELTRLDETTWGGIFHLSGGSAYLLLQEAGNWDDKYSVQDNSIPGAANEGPFGFRLPQDFPGNVAQGDNWYRMIYDFQIGRYTVTKVDHPLRPELYITGDGTPSSWTNSPPPSQRMTMLSSGVFEITMSFVPGKYFKFLDTNGQWQPQFGGDSPTGGALGANYGGGNDPSAIPTPAEAGDYKVQVNFITNTYTVTRI